MRILVTGATGLLGTELCRQLGPLAQLLGWGRRLPEHPVSPRVTYEAVDVTNLEGVRSGLDRWRPQVVVHTAAMTDVDASETQPSLAWEVNAKATQGLAESCRRVGAYLIAISTDYVFDGASARPYREEDPPHPINRYGESKLEGERLALASASRVLVVRVSGLFGPARPNFVTLAIQRFRAGESLPAVTNQRISPSYTVDLAMGIGKLITRYEKDPSQAEEGGALHGVLHLANSGGATRVEVAETVATSLGASMGLIHHLTWEEMNRPAKRPPQSQLDCSRFAQLTGSFLRPWEAAVKAFLDSEVLKNAS